MAIYLDIWNLMPPVSWGAGRTSWGLSNKLRLYPLLVSSEADKGQGEAVELTPTDLHTNHQSALLDTFDVYLTCVLGGQLYVAPAPAPHRLIVQAHPDHPFFDFLDGYVHTVLTVGILPSPGYTQSGLRLKPRHPVPLKFTVTRDFMENSGLFR